MKQTHSVASLKIHCTLFYGIYIWVKYTVSYNSMCIILQRGGIDQVEETIGKMLEKLHSEELVSIVSWISMYPLKFNFNRPTDPIFFAHI